MNDLLVLLPTRGRRELATACAESFAKTASDAEMLLITDIDDSSYDGIFWPRNVRTCIIPRLPLSGKLNQIALEQVAHYKALFFVGDDCVFETPGWDSIMMDCLENLGDTGILYADDKRRDDVPEHWLVSSDIILTLGWFSEPSLKHYWTDNVWGDIGRHTGILKLCSDAVIRHRHYQADSTASYDETYRLAEASGTEDAQAYQVWRHDKMDADVAAVQKLLRSKRKNPRKE